MKSSNTVDSRSCPSPVTRFVTYVHVSDVEASLHFYAALGFREDSRVQGGDGVVNWASARSGAAEIFLARATAPIVPQDQAVIFYMYCDDVTAMRSHLLDVGLHDGGTYRGQAGPNDGRCVVFDVSHPAYMTDGEIRVADPDGYCILIGQLT